MKRIPRSLRRQLTAEFGNQCAYCHTLTLITGGRMVIDHIIPEIAGGQTEWANVCLACHSCNEFKGTQVKATDFKTGRQVPLFHPRQQSWREHFRWSADGCEIVGLTPTGRATIVALNMNNFEIVEARRRWVAVGWHPPLEDV
ncbi:MAG: HNH endonuclease [Chloroflexota bacterium]